MQDLDDEQVENERKLQAIINENFAIKDEMDAVKEKAHKMLEEKDAEIDRLKAEKGSTAEELPPIVL